MMGNSSSFRLAIRLTVCSAPSQAMLVLLDEDGKRGQCFGGKVCLSYCPDARHPCQDATSETAAEGDGHQHVTSSHFRVDKRQRGAVQLQGPRKYAREWATKTLRPPSAVRASCRHSYSPMQAASPAGGWRGVA